MSIARRQAGTSQRNAKAAAEQRQAICWSWRHFATRDESGSIISFRYDHRMEVDLVAFLHQVLACDELSCACYSSFVLYKMILYSI